MCTTTTTTEIRREKLLPFRHFTNPFFLLKEPARNIANNAKP